MAMVIERVDWEPGSLAYFFLFCSCFSSVFLLPYFSRNSSAVATRASYSSLLDFGGGAQLLRFQRRFLLLYSFASVIGGIESVFGEDEYQRYGVSREQMVLCLCAGAAVSFFIGSFLGVVSDLIGPKKACIIYFILHLFVGLVRGAFQHPNIWVLNVCLALASSIFVFSFETWMAIEHDKQGHKQDLLVDTFWLMIFFESASLIGSQVLANVLIRNLDDGFLFSVPSAVLAIVSILYIRKEWDGCQHFSSLKDYWHSFSVHILDDKRIWLLSCSQACLHFSMSMFWILWAPTIVADGREVQLSLIYPCLVGSRMLGSTLVPWFAGAGSSLQNDDYLTVAFVIAGLCLTIVAYDYQEVGFLVILFCVFHACGGLILASLARLRTMYVPNELRASMISFSLLPANAAILFVLLQGGYYRNLSNAVIIALAALGLFVSAGCTYLLRRWKKHPREDSHKL